jgi:hypothetical protein
MRHAQDSSHRHALRRICTPLAIALTAFAVGAVPAMSTASAFAAGKSKHHAKHAKCKKGFVEKHGRCVSTVTPVYGFKAATGS